MRNRSNKFQLNRKLIEWYARQGFRTAYLAYSYSINSPKRGKSTTGSTEVTARGTGSVTQNTAITNST